jgi:hypothetical protein
LTQPDVQATALITGLPTYARPPPLALVSAPVALAARGRLATRAAPTATTIGRRLWLNSETSLHRPTGLADGLAVKEHRYEPAGHAALLDSPLGAGPSASQLGSPVPRHRRRREFGRYYDFGAAV